jgi:hypothetical protein
LAALSLVSEEALLQTFSASTGNDPYRTSVAMENHHKTSLYEAPDHGFATFMGTDETCISDI